MANVENVSLQSKGNPERARWAHLELLRSQSEHFGCTSSYPIGEPDQ